jgi:hypothetical protein
MMTTTMPYWMTGHAATWLSTLAEIESLPETDWPGTLSEIQNLPETDNETGEK